MVSLGILKGFYIVYNMSGYAYLLYINHSLFRELNHLALCTQLELYDIELTFLMVRLKNVEIMVGYEINNEEM